MDINERPHRHLITGKHDATLTGFTTEDTIFVWWPANDRHPAYTQTIQPDIDWQVIILQWPGYDIDAYVRPQP